MRQLTRCAVLGSPISHSLSPILHRSAYAELGLDWSYDRFEVTADELPGFVAGLGPEWRGLSLTMPLKEAVLQLGEVDDLARLAGAGNTLVFDADRPRVYNTDVAGLVDAIGRAGLERAPRVTILGAGATARSALVSAVRLGAERVTVVARTPAKARSLVELAGELSITIDVLPWTAPLPAADLLISTATAGAADSIAGPAAESAPMIVDAIYSPWPTVLADTATAVGVHVVGGRDMLIGQAVRQIELMTGRSVAADVLYAALPA